MGDHAPRESSPRVPLLSVEEPVASGWSECERMWVPQTGVSAPLLCVDWIHWWKGAIRDTP